MEHKAFHHTPFRCQTVQTFDKELYEFIRFLWHKLFEMEAVGLAAPQVGDDRRVAVVSTKDFFGCLINPEIIYKSQKTDRASEGCLSLEGETHVVKRSKEIEVEYQSNSRDKLRKHLSGFSARVVQHEIDHLNGKMINQKSQKGNNKGFGGVSS